MSSRSSWLRELAVIEDSLITQFVLFLSVILQVNLLFQNLQDPASLARRINHAALWRAALVVCVVFFFTSCLANTIIGNLVCEWATILRVILSKKKKMTPWLGLSLSIWRESNHFLSWIQKKRVKKNTGFLPWVEKHCCGCGGEHCFHDDY